MAKKKDLLPQIQNNFTAIKDEDTLPPEIMNLLEEKMPEFVKEYVADGTAVLRWMHEYLILMEEVLRLEYGFQEKDMMKIEKRIKEMLPLIHTMKMEDTKLLRKHDFAIAYDMIDRNKQVFKANQAGIALPSRSDIKQLK